MLETMIRTIKESVPGLIPRSTKIGLVGMNILCDSIDHIGDFQRVARRAREHVSLLHSGVTSKFKYGAIRGISYRLCPSDCGSRAFV